MNELFNHTFQLGHHTLTVFEIFEATLVVVLARIALGLARRALGRSTWLSGMDAGKQFIFRRLVSSGIWFVAALVALSALGVDLTALWAGSAALLVGVGIGLQGFFNDVVSGFVLLFEGGIAVGHILEVEGEIVRVKRIDLRSTRVETVSGEWIVLPNSKVSGEAVVNLSQGGAAVRISVEVGVAYGSDVEQVTALLKEAVMEQPETKDKPPVAVFFQDFGDSSLDFSVTGWIDDPWNRMAIQSRIRTAIDAKFRAHGVTIPFPSATCTCLPATQKRDVQDSLGRMARMCMLSVVRPRNVFWTKVNTKSISLILRTSSNRSPMPNPMASKRV